MTKHLPPYEHHMRREARKYQRGETAQQRKDLLTVLQSTNIDTRKTTGQPTNNLMKQRLENDFEADTPGFRQQVSNVLLTKIGQKTEELYIDSMTKDAFNETGGGTYISQEELAALGQIFRSADGTDIFEAITNIHIGGKEDMKLVFVLASKQKINLRKILQDPQLEKYTTRTSMDAFD